MVDTFDPCKPLKTLGGGRGSTLTHCAPTPARMSGTTTYMRPLKTLLIVWYDPLERVIASLHEIGAV